MIEINDISEPRLPKPWSDAAPIPLIAVLHLYEECGDLVGLRRMMEQDGAYLGGHEDPSVRAAYAEVVARAQAGFAIEDAHGPGSLLKLEHRAVKMLINTLQGSLIPPEQIAAAERFRELGLSAT